MIARVAPVCWGVDSLEILTGEMLDAFAAAGCAFVASYLGQSGMTADYLAAILSRGMMFAPIGGTARGGDWSAGSGHDDGMRFATRAHQLGIPSSVHVWTDAEGNGGSTEAWLDYCSSTPGPVLAAGYQSGLYPGAGCSLSGGQLYSLSGVTGYWEPCSLAPRVAVSGPMIQQWHHDDVAMFGAVVDLDFVGPDRKGRFPVMVSQ